MRKKYVSGIAVATLLLSMCQGASAAVQMDARAGSYNSSFSIYKN